MPKKELEHGHHPHEIATRLRRGPRVSYLRDWVYGGIDGTITTFAIITGVAGAALSTNALLILGAANLIADGFSMAAANYSGTRAEIEEYDHVRRMEERHVEVAPEGEREEIRQIFTAKGFKGKTLESAIDVITENRERWIETMMTEEHGLPPITRSPLKAALVTFAAFSVCGLIPLMPFVLGAPAGLWTSTAAAAVTFFSIGSFRSRWSSAPWWRAGLETLAIGMIAAGLAYGVGSLLGGFLHAR